MRRTCLWMALAACFVAGPTRPAWAQWWAWMEEYSGPGPFKDDGLYLSMTPFCWGADRDAAAGREPIRRGERWLGLGSADSPRCIYFDWQSLEASPDPGQGYPRIDAHTLDIGVSVRLHAAVDLGVGLGVARFHPDAPGAEVTSKFVAVPARIVVRPLLLFHDFTSRRHRTLASIVKIYFKQSYVAGRLTGADFGAPANPFQVDGEAVGSMALVFDLLEAVRAW